MNDAVIHSSKSFLSLSFEKCLKSLVLSKHLVFGRRIISKLMAKGIRKIEYCIFKLLTNSLKSCKILDLFEI